MERKFIPGKTFSTKHMGIPQEVVFFFGNSRKIYVPEFQTGILGRMAKFTLLQCIHDFVLQFSGRI